MSNQLRSSMLRAGLLAGIAGQSLLGQLATPMPVAEEFERLHFRSIGPAVNSGRI